MDPRPTTITFSPTPRKPKMSLSQTYYIAASARSKLGREAARADHNLRRLVGHANLLDSLMVELQDAEREQERWFNQTVSKASEKSAPVVRWADTIVEEEVDEDDDGSDSEDEYTAADYIMSATPIRSIRQPAVLSSTTTSSSTSSDADLSSDSDSEDDDDEYIYQDDDEDLPELALVRTASNNIHSPPSPPELVHDSDSEDESSPPASPPQQQLDMVFPALDRKTKAAMRQTPMIAALA